MDLTDKKVSWYKGDKFMRYFSNMGDALKHTSKMVQVITEINGRDALLAAPFSEWKKININNGFNRN